MMKDALLDCLKNNYYDLYRMIASFLPDRIDIESAGIVKNIYERQAVSFQRKNCLGTGTPWTTFLRKQFRCSA
jgi:hypothetical protein